MNNIIQNHLNTIKSLCKQYKVKSLYSFGSVNTTSFTDKSDIDLVTRRSLSNPFFIQDVEQTKILIYG